ncbi:hypothetical protein ACFWV1_26270 [Streptomyces sp. NPDC058700]|uniref:hypothetical protein n=1 Tax=Streptomyces sp. NPDC058700 TaxID=3346607 RepID=UPI0036575912
MTSHEPYPADTLWTFRTRQSSYQPTTPLYLYWEVDSDWINDEHTPDEISARDLWDRWYSAYATDGPVAINWSVRGDRIFESAPFSPSPYLPEDFLTHYTWPEHAKTGDPLNWARLPVADRLWNTGRNDKGGFIQQLTGWKPSPFQAHFDAARIAKAVGLNRL